MAVAWLGEQSVNNNVLYVWACSYHTMHVEAREELCGVPPLHGSGCPIQFIKHLYPLSSLAELFVRDQQLVNTLVSFASDPHPSLPLALPKT